MLIPQLECIGLAKHVKSSKDDACRTGPWIPHASHFSVGTIQD